MNKIISNVKPSLQTKTIKKQHTRSTTLWNDYGDDTIIHIPRVPLCDPNHIDLSQCSPDGQHCDHMEIPETTIILYSHSSQQQQQQETDSHDKNKDIVVLFVEG